MTPTKDTPEPDPRDVEIAQLRAALAKNRAAVDAALALCHEADRRSPTTRSAIPLIHERIYAAITAALADTEGNSG